MCIAILNNGSELTKQELQNCWISNDDGAGMLFIENDKLVACKYPNADGYGKAEASFDEFYADYREAFARSKSIGMPMLLHFRIATHGFDEKYLHPFFISEDVGMIHNGVITGFGSKEVSDTAEFAQELSTLPESMLSSVAFLDTKFVYNAIYEYIGDYNKLVFMDKHGDVSIFNEQAGHWVGDNWFSNDSYKSLTRYHGHVAKGSVKDWGIVDDFDWYDKYATEPYIEDKTYPCSTCNEETLVDWDACCVTCGHYVVAAESDVIEKMEMDEDLIL